MRRRDFLKATGVGAGLAGCSTEPWKRLPLLVTDPPRALAEESFRPGLCRECGAGCGVLARVIAAEGARPRVVKLEGNPAHPISRGALCARGQTSLDRLYAPERLLHPLARGDSGELHRISWQQAIARLAAALTRLTNPRRLVVVGAEPRGTTGVLFDRWLAELGAAPIYRARGDDDAWSEAVRLMTGASRAPGYDLAGVATAVVFGADLLGAGPSPVRDTRGRAAQRAAGGRLVYVGTRFNLTAAAADRFLPCRPGTEGAVALGIAHVLLRDPALDRQRLGARVHGLDDHYGMDGKERPGFARIAQQYPPSKVEALSGVASAAIEEVAAMLVAHQPAIAIAGGAAAAQVGSLASMMAVVALNGLIAGFDRGGLTFAPALSDSSTRPSGGPHDLLRRLADPEPIEILLLVESAGAPHELPELAGRMSDLPLIASYSSSSVQQHRGVHLALPATHALEEFCDDEPNAATATVTMVAPVLTPRGEAWSLVDIVNRLAPGSRVDVASRERYRGLAVDEILVAGGWAAGASAPRPYATPSGKLELSPVNPAAMVEPMAGGMVAMAAELLPHFAPPRFAGDEREWPLVLEPFASFAGMDGGRTGALNEIAEPLAGVVWQSWVEIHPQVAERYGVRDGDLVQVATPLGETRARACVRPWASPEILAMPWSAAASLAARERVAGTGERAWAGTRARIARVDG